MGKVLVWSERGGDFVHHREEVLEVTDLCVEDGDGALEVRVRATEKSPEIFLRFRLEDLVRCAR